VSVKLRTGTLVVVLCLFFSFSLFAQKQPLEAGKPLGELLAQMKSRPGGGGPRANIIAVDWADSSFLIPAAGNVAGAGGTHFRSDITIINYNSTPQRVAVGWMPAGQNNCASPTQVITLNPGWRYFEDFVGSTLGQTGLGALLFLGVDAAGNADDNAELDGFSRIWTRQANSTGTSSQQFPPVGLDDLVGSLEAYSIGLRHDSGFRTNAGVVNLDNAAHTWDVEVWGAGMSSPATFAITAQPCSLQQGAIPAGNYGPLLLSFQQRSPTGLYWTAYGSSTDNVTGDGWIVHSTHGL
jgi:hypothetical protein